MVLTPNQALKILQTKTGYSLQKVGEISGLGGERDISQYQKFNIKLAVFEKIVNVFGYEIVIRPKGSLDADEYIVIHEDLKERKLSKVKNRKSDII